MHGTGVLGNIEYGVNIEITTVFKHARTIPVQILTFEITRNKVVS